MDLILLFLVFRATASAAAPCAILAGACGALYASIVGLGATGTGVTGIFGLLLCLNDPLNYIIMFLISAGVAFALTWMFGYKDKDLAESKK